MANKSRGRNWREIQLAIATISVTATLGFWNLFSTQAKSLSAAQAAPSDTPPTPPPPGDTVEPTATTLALRPVKIIYAGIAPPQQLAIQVTPSQVAPSQQFSGQAPAAPATKKRKSGGGNPASVQPATTGSSR